jgi:hypothetical protein
MPLEHSHNMPVKHYPDLEDDPRNFSLRCRECHKILDYPDFEKIVLFRDFSSLMAYRKGKCVNAFNQWVSALIAIGNKSYSYIEDEDCNFKCDVPCARRRTRRLN